MGRPERAKGPWEVLGVGFATVETRRCADCQDEMTIRGVWFLVPEAAGDGEGEGSGFLCEDCYARRSGGLRGSTLEREPSGRGSPAG